MGSPTARFEPREARKGAAVEESGCGGPFPFVRCRGDAPGRCLVASRPEHFHDGAIVSGGRVEREVHDGGRDVLRTHCRPKAAIEKHFRIH